MLRLWLRAGELSLSDLLVLQGIVVMADMSLNSHEVFDIRLLQEVPARLLLLPLPPWFIVILISLDLFCPYEALLLRHYCCKLSSFYWLIVFHRTIEVFISFHYGFLGLDI